MIHLLFVVPYPELMEQVKEVVANHPEREKVNADVQALQVDEISDIPAGTYDAIIAKAIQPRRHWQNIQRQHRPSVYIFPVMILSGQFMNAVKNIILKRLQYVDQMKVCLRRPVYVKYWE